MLVETNKEWNELQIYTFYNSLFKPLIFAKYIPFVIGMEKAIPDKTAIQFSSTFYKALAKEKNARFAFQYAKAALAIDSVEADLVVLYTKIESR